MADKIDAGLIMMNASPEDVKMLEPLIEKGFPVPDTKISVYKNRRGKYNGIYIWCCSRKGVCKIEGQYVTTWNYEYTEVPGTKIVKSAF